MPAVLRLIPGIVLSAALTLQVSPMGASPQRPVPAPSQQTALDRYVAVPDPSFAWKVSKELPTDGGAPRPS